MSESRLVDHAFSRILGYPDILVGREVPLLGRYVDLVYFRHGRITTVEFKLHDWRRAIKQAIDHLLGADHSAICVPPRQISEQMESAIRDAGLGLFIFDACSPWPFEERISAPRSRDTWQVARENVLQFIRDKWKLDLDAPPQAL